MIHPQGFAAHPAFQKNGRSVIDTRRLYFDGNSQGAIMGGGLTAVAPDFERARARRAGHELLDAAAAQRRLRHLRSAAVPRLPDRDRRASCCSRRSSCCGTAARPTATPTT